MERITELIKGGDPKQIASYMKETGLSFAQDGRIVPNMDRLEWAKGQITFWDQRQQAR